MQKQGVCQICGKSIPVGCHICHACKVQADSQKEWTGYQPEQPILVSSDFVQHFIGFTVNRSLILR